MRSKRIRPNKSHYNFGILTIVVVFSMLCVTATACVTMLTSYMDYEEAQRRAEEVQAYYSTLEFESEEP